MEKKERKKVAYDDSNIENELQEICNKVKRNKNNKIPDFKKMLEENRKSKGTRK